jgi:apolipoprotein N-acyltransferase
LSADDPYAPLPPPIWEKYPRAVPAVAVGIATALLTLFMFPPFHAPELAYVFAAPAMFWAYRKPSLRIYVWTLFAAQSVAWIGILIWLRHVSWVGLLLLGPLVGVWVGVWYLAVWWAMPRMRGQPHGIRLAAQLGLAGLWVVLEWTRTWFITGFPWLPLAASQWQRTVVLQIAAYTGAGGVSFVLIAVNIGFAAYAHRLFFEKGAGFKRRSQEFMLGVFLLLGCLCLFFRDGPNRRFVAPLARVAFIQPDIPQSVKWEPGEADSVVRTLYGLTLLAGQVQPDFMLWPESALPVELNLNAPGQDRQIVDYIDRQAKSPLLFGAEAEKDDRWYDAAFVATPEGGVQPGYYAKRHLVPFGEYVPWHWLFGWVKKVVPIGDDATPGPEVQEPLAVPLRNSTAVLEAGPLICYEDVFPSLARESVRMGAQALVVLTNDAWYGEEGAAYQHAAHSVLRAVETRRPVLRDGNAGWSGWIDEFGSFSTGEEDEGQSGRSTILADKGSVYFRGERTISILHDIRWAGRQTFYVRHGDWFVLVCVALAVFGYWIVRTPAPAPLRKKEPLEI